MMPIQIKFDETIAKRRYKNTYTIFQIVNNIRNTGKSNMNFPKQIRLQNKSTCNSHLAMYTTRQQ